ncbi:MAG: hypothetical protein R6V26_12340 [Roseovarius sp.]
MRVIWVGEQVRCVVSVSMLTEGYRGHDAMLKAETMRTKWIPAVNRLGSYGRWGFAELRDIHDFGPGLDVAISEMLGSVPA